MHRYTTPPRANWQSRLNDIGFTWQQDNGQPYWEETAHWTFNADQVDEIEAATEELYDMVRGAARYVVNNALYKQFGVPDNMINAVASSLNDDGIYGRFDLAYNGINPPKLIEFNADTPTSLFEASIVQWNWLQDKGFPDQFNSMHERLIAAWQKQYYKGETLHVAFVAESVEDRGTCAYIAETAVEAGLQVKLVPIDKIALFNGRFIDQEGCPILNLFKLYPWDWLIDEAFGPTLLTQVDAGTIRVIEPAWKLVASHKALLPLLWQLNPGHPLLLEAHTDIRLVKDGTWVTKPILGREGANITIFERTGVKHYPIEETTGPYEETAMIFQKYVELPSQHGRNALIGSWIIGGEAAGMGIRESNGLITDNMARFVPHTFG